MLTNRKKAGKLPAPATLSAAMKVSSRQPEVLSAIVDLGSFDGILFVGDPHVNPMPPGRRKDDYLASVLGKLEFATEYANDKNLLIVCLGDLFHRQGINSLTTLNRLTRVLNKANHTWIVLDGNHDRDSAALTDDCAMTLLAQTGTILVPPNVGHNYRAEIAGKVVDLHFFPHEVPLPDEVLASDNITIGVTHHTLAFEGGTFEGLVPLKAIRGMDMVVNGHLHDTKEPELHGATYWHNPGNIEPLSLDVKDFVPHVWEWAPSLGFGTLTPIALPHGTDLFDMQGLQVEAGDTEEAVRVLENSEFAAQIRQTDQSQADQTDDAELFKADVLEVLDLSMVSPEARALVQLLAQAVQNDAVAASESGALLP